MKNIRESRLIRVALIGVGILFLIWLLSFLYSIRFVEQILPNLPEDSMVTEEIVLKVLSIFTVTVIPSIAGIIIALISRYGLREAAQSLPGTRGEVSTGGSGIESNAHGK